MKKILEQEIKSVNISEKDYPKCLKRTDNAPKKIYYRGEFLNDNEQYFAIVGTRRASDYGKEIAFSFARDLASAGLTVVSGMAKGIDTFSHKGALEAGGKTIAVLGTGLSQKAIYPQENLGLAKKILETGGCLLSEYPPEYPGNKFTFPQRNRIIAGMSLGILVVEAKFGSGALITAKLAKKQDKPVFAVPGPIHCKNSQGPHSLIKQGAILVEKPQDILDGLKIQKRIIFSRLQQNDANKNEQRILTALEEDNLHIDKIIAKTNLSAQEVSAALSLMEINGVVKNLGANVYVAVH